MNRPVYVICLSLLCFGCSKNSPAPTVPTITWDGNVVAYAPVAVSKSISKRVFAHIMPWFETPVTNTFSAWGQHWTMTNRTPPGNIASYYYPMIGPYGSGDTAVIDYQLLLMKLSGIDGIYIDWPGTTNSGDYPKNVKNSEAIISRLGKAGLTYAIVYEDRNLSQGNKITQGQADMNYMQAKYFSDPNYEKISGKPLLLVFGPVTITQSADWTTVFSVLPVKPAFFTIQNQSSQAGVNATGEFAWVVQNSLTGSLTNFYSKTYSGTKISAAFPGFKSFYAAGGWPSTGLTWVIEPSVAVFQQTLTLALQQTNNNYIQLITWNDYGEGTMIEPTTQLGYGFLTTLQQQLGVQSLSQSDLELVAKLYTARVNNILPTYNPVKLKELDQVYYYITSLKMDSAKALLQQDF